MLDYGTRRCVSRPFPLPGEDVPLWYPSYEMHLGGV
jgi:hypothetical protein